MSAAASFAFVAYIAIDTEILSLHPLRICFVACVHLYLYNQPSRSTQPSICPGVSSGVAKM